MNYTPRYIYRIYYTVYTYMHNEEETTLDFLILLLGGSVLKLSIFRHSFCMIAAYQPMLFRNSSPSLSTGQLLRMMNILFPYENILYYITFVFLLLLLKETRVGANCYCIYMRSSICLNYNIFDVIYGTLNEEPRQRQ